MIITKSQYLSSWFCKDELIQLYLQKVLILAYFFQNFKHQNTILLKSFAFNKHFET